MLALGGLFLSSYICMIRIRKQSSRDSIARIEESRWVVASYESTDYLNLITSLGSEFSSQGHFHSPQLSNVSQFLFSQPVRLTTAPRGNFSHP